MFAGDENYSDDQLWQIKYLEDTKYFIISNKGKCGGNACLFFRRYKAKMTTIKNLYLYAGEDAPENSKLFSIYPENWKGDSFRFRWSHPVSNQHGDYDEEYMPFILQKQWPNRLSPYMDRRSRWGDDWYVFGTCAQFHHMQSWNYD